MLAVLSRRSCEGCRKDCRQVSRLWEVTRWLVVTSPVFSLQMRHFMKTALSLSHPLLQRRIQREKLLSGFGNELAQKLLN